MALWPVQAGLIFLTLGCTTQLTIFEEMWVDHKLVKDSVQNVVGTWSDPCDGDCGRRIAASERTFAPAEDAFRTHVLDQLEPQSKLDDVRAYLMSLGFSCAYYHKLFCKYVARHYRPSFGPVGEIGLVIYTFAYTLPSYFFDMHGDEDEYFASEWVVIAEYSEDDGSIELVVDITELGLRELFARAN